jgi:NADH-quinone oxidoreductase subunit G
MSQELVNITIDGQKLQVLKGTNIVDAAHSAGIEIPHYCYHPHLSVAGNCRMCQVELNGRPKLEIACNTSASEGLEVKTHNTSKAVADAQAATLEFILINHPLDCTVCDQAGHCKLQDYHYEYNARPSRFLEDKEHKVKALPLGPTVMLDGERCIMCSRCVRFCDEVTKTSEIGLLNRGDKTVIAVNPENPLDNELSGTVVDLCPVGALTHKEWRFNTRIWFTKQSDGICPGCSTGCNVKVASRDGEIVQVKARLNSDVNKEWLCDEGRYGFNRFLPNNRITETTVSGKSSSISDVANLFKNFNKLETVFFLSPDLLAEDFFILSQLKNSAFKESTFVVQYKERNLNEVQKVLVSPDYACNFQSAKLFGVAGENLASEYLAAVKNVEEGKFKNIVVIGDRGLNYGDITPSFLASWSNANSIFIGSDANHTLIDKAKTVVAGRSILERSGILINRNLRAQYTDKFLDPIDGTTTDSLILLSIAKSLNVSSLNAAFGINNDRDLTVWFLGLQTGHLNGTSIKKLKSGVSLQGAGI